MKKQIVVAGCGVTGLTTAIGLQEEGFDVHIVTSELPLQTTSIKAAAFWFPYHARDSEEILKWSMVSYHRFQSISHDVHSGVHMTPLYKLGAHVSETERRIKDTLSPDKFRPLRNEELRGDFEEGWHLEVPLIETPIYLPFLQDSFLNNGGKIFQRKLYSLDELSKDGYFTINCTGLGARQLADDDQLIPVRGQIVLLKTENRRRIILEDLAPTYIVYRSDGCICGGTYETGCDQITTEASAIHQILERCTALEPGLKSAEVISQWAGLRPYRAEMRVEMDQSKPIIHNYGHGGSGFTVSWGCAEEVVQLLKNNH